MKKLFLLFAIIISPSEVSKLIDNLGAEDYITRVTAIHKLEKLETFAVPYLKKGLQNPDVEIRFQCRRLLVKAYDIFDQYNTMNSIWYLDRAYRFPQNPEMHKIRPYEEERESFKDIKKDIAKEYFDKAKKWKQNHHLDDTFLWEQYVATRLLVIDLVDAGKTKQEIETILNTMHQVNELIIVDEEKME